MQTIALAKNAMATRFEIVLHGGAESFLRAAGEEALEEVARLEANLSIYKPNTQIARVNARAAIEPVRVDGDVFQLLKQSLQLSEELGGFFDITIAPLMKCWGFVNGTGNLPNPADLEEARENVGWQHVLLDPDKLTVSFKKPGLMIDLGAIGKGRAVEVAVATLQEAGVENALVHGGTSTIYGLGSAPNGAPWKISLEYPPECEPKFRKVVELHNEAVSVSGVWGKAFEHEGKLLGHVIDPASGWPVTGAVMSAAVMPSATETDAFSTALLVSGDRNFQELSKLRPNFRGLALIETSEGLTILETGF